MNLNSFCDDYKNYFLNRICLDSIRKELNIPESDKLKKNGTFKRGLYYTINNVLRYTIIKIQTLLWTKASGEERYISIFPSFVVKYNKVSTDVIELISTNVGKGESIFKYIDDSHDLIENEDILTCSCNRVNKAVADKKITGLLNAKYTEIFNTTIPSINFVDYKVSNLVFKEIYILLKVAVICSEALILKDFTLSFLNGFFKFLR